MIAHNKPKTTSKRNLRPLLESIANICENHSLNENFDVFCLPKENVIDQVDYDLTHYGSSKIRTLMYEVRVSLNDSGEIKVTGISLPKSYWDVDRVLEIFPEFVDSLSKDLKNAGVNYEE